MKIFWERHRLLSLRRFSKIFYGRKGQVFMNWIDRIALILLIVGGLNWGSVGLFQYDLVGALFGGMSGIVSRIIFTLVGIAGLWCISLLFRGSED